MDKENNANYLFLCGLRLLRIRELLWDLAKDGDFPERMNQESLGL
jgi:hypothetical protein